MAAKSKAAAKSKRKRRSGGLEVAPASAGDNSTVSIRRIKNGFLVERSFSKRGRYHSEQVFSPTDPLKLGKVKMPGPQAAK